MAATTASTSLILALESSAVARVTGTLDRAVAVLLIAEHGINREQLSWEAKTLAAHIAYAVQDVPVHDPAWAAAATSRFLDVHARTTMHSGP